MSGLHLIIDADKITHNTRMTLGVCRSLGVEVVGVTKGAAGDPVVAQAMLEGGIKTLADSRLDNIERMRHAGIQAPIMLLRSPGPSEVARCIALADSSLNVDQGVMEALSQESVRSGKKHGVLIMVDLDTGREGLPPNQIAGACRKVQSLPGLELQGIGLYFHMTSGSDFHLRALQEFVGLVSRIRREFGIRLPVLSGGSSNIFRTMGVEGHPNPGINHLRIGTAILLGFSSSLNPMTIPGFERETFLLEAEVIEVKAEKRKEAILALGRLDTDPEFLFPRLPGAKVRDATSDHLIVELSEVDQMPRVGESLRFWLAYPALTRLMVSPYVRREYVPS